MRRFLWILCLLCCSACLSVGYAQTEKITVSGIVTDEQNQNLPGVTVFSGNPLRAIGSTTAKGSYSVTIDRGAVIVFRYLGYLERRITHNSRERTIDVKMQVDNNQLQEVQVVVRGYVQRSKELSTGSSFTISGKEIQEVPVANVEQLLQGRVPGLNIQNNTGAPGFRGSTQVRGLSTMTVTGSGSESFLQPTSPLYVIDGVPLDADKASEFGFQQQGPGMSPLSLIPQEDIESIEILKDAQATSMYGSRAAYGVIIITTKRGNSPVPRVRYIGNAFMKTPPKLRETLGGNLERQFKIQQILSNAIGMEDIYAISQSPFLSDSLNAYYNNSTNWQDIFYRTTYNQTHNIAIDGGNKKLNYKANIGYFGEKGVIQNTGFQRFNLNTRMEFRPSERFAFSGTVYGQIGKQNKGNGVGLLQQGVANNGQASTLLPGPSFFQSSSGVASSLRTNNDNSTRNLRTNIDANFMVIEGLRLTTNLSYDFSSNLEDTFTPAAANNQFARVYAFNGRDYQLYNRNSINYSKTFNEKHNFFINAFSEIYKKGTQNSITRQDKSPNDQFQGPWGFDAWASRGGGVLTNFKDARQASFAGSLSYDFMRKYIIDLSYRLDGDSGSGIDNPYSKNPAIGLRWNFNKEKWFEDSEWLNLGALRLSWGKNIVPSTNLEVIYGKYNIGGMYNNVQGIGIDYRIIPNPILKPVTTEQYNLGVDLSLFGNKIDLIYDTYYKDVSNLLFERYLPNTSAFDILLSNDASIVNYGHEVSLTIRPLPPSSKFNWSFTINGAYNRDVLTGLPAEYNGQFIQWADPNDVYRQHIAKRIGRNALSNYLRINDGVYSQHGDVPVDPVTGKRYQTNGRYFEAGDPILRDLNGDFILDDFDYALTGNSQPLFTGGIYSTLSYGQWSVAIYTSFTAKRTVLNNALSDRLSLMRDPFALEPNAGPRAVVPLNGIDIWMQPGDVAKYPYAYDYTRYGSILPFRPDQTLWEEDGSYLKINSIILSYMFTKRFARNLGLNNIKVYLSTENLYTFSNYSGPNPENVTNMGRDVSGGYPVPRTYNIGINVDF